MRHGARPPAWAWLAPLVGWGVLAAGIAAHAPLLAVLQGGALIACVLAAVHHADIVALRVGEPLGTVLLALAVTVIEIGLIAALMMSDAAGTAALARDTVFASVMIILNGMVGICLLVAALRHGEQSFGLYGVSVTLTALSTITVITLILPNTTTTAAGASYTPAQLVFVAVVSLLVYGVFLLVQAVRHRAYFLPPAGAPAREAARPGRAAAGIGALLMLACLGAVILLAKALAPSVEAVASSVQAPKAVVGVVIAAIVLLPEGLSALAAARANRIQTSLNLALGSAMASIGLTIPVVAAISLATHHPLVLGLDLKGTTLLGLSLLVASVSLGTGRTIGLQGVVHLVIFGVYLFTTAAP
jgi:Ca2+:H+ antiporter